MITLEQMRQILASDEPTDMWLLHEDGSITAHPETPDAPISFYLRPDTWPRYICRSMTVENLCLISQTHALTWLNNQLEAQEPATLARRLRKTGDIVAVLKGRFT